MAKKKKGKQQKNVHKIGTHLSKTTTTNNERLEVSATSTARESGKRSNEEDDQAKAAHMPPAGDDDDASTMEVETEAQFQPTEQAPHWETWNWSKLKMKAETINEYANHFQYWKDEEDNYMESPATGIVNMRQLIEVVWAQINRKKDWLGDDVIDLLRRAFQKDSVMRRTKEFTTLRMAAMDIALMSPMDVFIGRDYWDEDRRIVDKETVVWMASQEMLGAPWAPYHSSQLLEELEEKIQALEDIRKAHKRAQDHRAERRQLVTLPCPTRTPIAAAPPY